MARAQRKPKAKDTENGSGVTKRTPKGLKKLSEEADKAIGEASPEITQELANHAKQGDIAYTEYLIELAEKGVKQARKAVAKRLETSVAERWANEPVWTGSTPAAATKPADAKPAADAVTAEKAAS